MENHGILNSRNSSGLWNAQASGASAGGLWVIGTSLVPPSRGHTAEARVRDWHSALACAVQPGWGAVGPSGLLPWPWEEVDAPSLPAWQPSFLIRGKLVPRRTADAPQGAARLGLRVPQMKEGPER